MLLQASNEYELLQLFCVMLQGCCYTSTSQVIKKRESCFYVLKNKINVINTVNRDKNLTLKCLACLKKTK